MAAIPDGMVRSEFAGLAERPVSEEERKTACRAIVRFKGQRGQGNAEDDESPMDVTEDWVRLYVALRRASGTPTVRLSATQLRRWRVRACVSPRL